MGGNGVLNTKPSGTFFCLMLIDWRESVKENEFEELGTIFECEKFKESGMKLWVCPWFLTSYITSAD